MPTGYKENGEKLIPPSWKGRKHSLKTKIKMKHSAQKYYQNHKNSLRGFKTGNSLNKNKPKYSIRGPLHYNWKGNTPLKHTVRNVLEMRQWRSDIFQRDNYTCQICGIKGGILHADHIKPFIQIWEEYKINSLEDALNCVELWNINNGRTLCKNCHLKTDTWGNKKKK